MHIRELTSLTGVSERQVRFLIAEGFVPAPSGGRAHAEYGEQHLLAINRYMRLKGLGFPPAAIKVLLEAREGVPFPIADGALTLIVSPHLIGSGADPAGYLAEIRDRLTEILKEPKDAP